MITIKAKRAKNLKEKIVGLINRDSPENLVIKTHFGIHTFLMKFPIDVIILDNKNNVIALKENLKPNRIFLWNPKYEIVVECRLGLIKKKGIKKGDTIKIS